MRTITKGIEPTCLTNYRRQDGCNYHDFNDKDILRAALVKEQRRLCCYCMGRIHEDDNDVKIEHWKSQSRYPQYQLDYNNLLAVCKGGKGKRYKDEYCDTRKKENDLKWNPANANHHIERHLHYGGDGTIWSDDNEFEDQINKVLNLNLARICNNRKRLFDEIYRWWKAEVSETDDRVARIRLERKREKFISGTNDLIPYCQVAIYFLDQKISELQP